MRKICLIIHFTSFLYTKKRGKQCLTNIRIRIRITNIDFYLQITKWRMFKKRQSKNKVFFKLSGKKSSKKEIFDFIVVRAVAIDVINTW